MRKGDRVVVKTNAGEVMAKVLARQTTKSIELHVAQSRSSEPRYPHARCRMGGAHRLGKPVGAGMRPLQPWPSLAIAGDGRPCRRRRSRVQRDEGRGSRHVDQIQADARRRVPRAGHARPFREPQPTKPAPHSRTIDPEMVAPPPLNTEELQRVEPRAPLSELALAGPPKPPKPKMPDDWNGTKLYQPVATAAGMIEAKGYSVAVAGIDVVGQDETCTDERQAWACGIRARTAFRAFLRGRAVACAVPPEGGRDLITAECRIGKQDVGAMAGRERLGPRRRRAALMPRPARKRARPRRASSAPPPMLAGLPPAPAVTHRPAAQPILDAAGRRGYPPAEDGTAYAAS